MRCIAARDLSSLLTTDSSLRSPNYAYAAASRFDLIYLILDKPDPTSDRQLANHLVGLYQAQRRQNPEGILVRGGCLRCRWHRW